MPIGQKIVGVAVAATVSLSAVAFVASPALADEAAPTTTQDVPTEVETGTEEVAPAADPVEEEAPAPEVAVPEETEPEVVVPSEEAPVEEVPTEEAPVEEVPVEEVPAEENALVATTFALTFGGDTSTVPENLTLEVHYTSLVNDEVQDNVVYLTRDVPPTAIDIPEGSTVQISVTGLPDIENTTLNPVVLLNGNPLPAEGVTLVSGEVYDFSVAIDAVTENPAPSDAPAIQQDEALPVDVENFISVNAAVAFPGDTVTVSASSVATPESWVSVWIHSTPVLLAGWVQTDVNGNIDVTIPAGTETGEHRIVVSDADNNIVGWTSILVVNQDDEVIVPGEDPETPVDPETPTDPTLPVDPTTPTDPEVPVTPTNPDAGVTPETEPETTPRDPSSGEVSIIPEEEFNTGGYDNDELGNVTDRGDRSDTNTRALAYTGSDSNSTVFLTFMGGLMLIGGFVLRRLPRLRAARRNS